MLEQPHSPRPANAEHSDMYILLSGFVVLRRENIFPEVTSDVSGRMIVTDNKYTSVLPKRLPDPDFPWPLPDHLGKMTGALCELSIAEVEFWHFAIPLVYDLLPWGWHIDKSDKKICDYIWLHYNINDRSFQAKVWSLMRVKEGLGDHYEKLAH